MKVKVDLDASYLETEVVVKTNEMTNDVNHLIHVITDFNTKPTRLIGKSNERIVPIEIEDIVRVFVEEKKVYVSTMEDTYVIKQRLYEVEALLEFHDFIRISRFELIHLNKIKYFKVSFDGSLMVVLNNDEETFVSRRYIKALYERLGV